MVWASGWLAFVGLRNVGVPGALALAAAVLISVAIAWPIESRWRRVIASTGFPLSALAAGGLPSWAWLLALVPLALAYPMRAWRDAPFFPTPRGALDGLDRIAPLVEGARVLDAGCGLGHGLRALRTAYPHAVFDGIEWSRPLASLTALRCRFASIRRGDMWAPAWSAYGLVYVFQRPESMPRVWDKACRDMSAGSFLVSLEFPVPGVEPAARLEAGPRPAFVYRIPNAIGAHSQPPHDAADISPMLRADHRPPR